MQPLQVSLSCRQELEGNLILASTAANLFVKITQWDAHAWPIKFFFCIEFKGYKNIYAIKILHVYLCVSINYIIFTNKFSRLKFLVILGFFFKKTPIKFFPKKLQSTLCHEHSIMSRDHLRGIPFSTCGLSSVPLDFVLDRKPFLSNFYWPLRVPCRC